MLYYDRHVYDLSFRGPTRSAGRKVGPKIILTCSSEDWATAIKYIRERPLHNPELVQKYCNKELQFEVIGPDLFGHKACGFGLCGHVEERDGEVSIAIELGRIPNSRCTLTLQTLFLALNYCPSEHRPNRTQQVHAETVCDPNRYVWGHMVGGYISSSVIAWIRTQGAQMAKKGKSTEASARITKAMQQTWRAVAPEHRMFVTDCKVYLWPQGNFSLVCFGNACDLSLYPDQLRNVDDGSVRFGCHNLDTSAQQLTLLAGLAKLCEEARAETNH